MESAGQDEGVESDEEPVVSKIPPVRDGNPISSGESGRPRTDSASKSAERTDDFIEAVMKTVGISEPDSFLENQDLLSLTHELDTLLDRKNNLSTPPPLINLSPFECTKLQQEELEALRAIYGEDIRCLSETCFVVDVKFLTDTIQDHDVIKIWFSFPPNYPSVPPVFELEASQSGVVSYSDADELYDCFVTESFKKIGEMMIFDLVTLAQDFMSSLIERKVKYEEERKKADQLRKDKLEDEAAKKATGMEPPAESHVEAKNPIGEKVDTLLWSGVLLKPTQFIGRISEIINKLPDDLEITRIENVLRQDLAQRFCETLREASSQLWKKERSYPHEINLKPQVAFHGTVTSNLPSIVQQGLVIPGKGNKVKVRCGSSLGLGIYLSPKPEYSLGYSSSDRLIVCAALQGRIYKDGASNSHAPHSRFFSVVSSCGNEWVFFNAGQVLPCYVIKVKKCDSKKRPPQPPPLHSLLNSEAASQTVTDRKAALLARARKFLPYGFGPGTQTIIEDAGSFDDDEEDYGEYQESRHAENLETGYEYQDFRWQK